MWLQDMSVWVVHVDQESSADDVLEMSVARGVRSVDEVYEMCMARYEVGGDRIRLGLYQSCML